MSTRLRIATFNLENLDDKPDSEPTLADRIAVIRPQLIRLNADILCLQEVNGQETVGEPRQLLALKQLLEDTPYLDYYLVSTKTADGEQVYNERNLVILSRFEILNSQQFKGKYASFPLYQQVTAIPEKTQAERVDWERPIFHAQIELPDGNTLEVINLHFKSKLPSKISGQKKDCYSWKSASGWAEGFFLSALKRVGQALETRIFIDSLFDDNQDSLIAVCGDFNAEADETPVEAICGDIENTNLGWVMMRTMKTSGAESFSCAANIFVGQTEAPLIIKPYLPTLTMSELHAVMTGGFATIAGGVMAAYISLGIPSEHLIAASVMSAPAALAMSKIFYPETAKPETTGKIEMEVKSNYTNALDAITTGALDGLKLALNVGAMLIAFLGLLALVNGLLGWMGGQLGLPQLSLEWILSYLMFPFAWLMGIPLADCSQVGILLRKKVILNEFIAYLDL